MTLTIAHTMRELWIYRGEVSYFVHRLEAAGHTDESRELAQAGYKVGRALLELSELVEQRQQLIDSVTKEGAV